MDAVYQLTGKEENTSKPLGLLYEGWVVVLSHVILVKPRIKVFRRKVVNILTTVSTETSKIKVTSHGIQHNQ